MGTLATISGYIEKHEKLIVVLVLGALLYVGYGRVQAAVEKHDKSQETQAQIIASAQQAKDNALAVQANAQAAQYQALAEKVQAQNAALEQANITLATALAKQQHTDASLPPTELANRWTVLVPQAKPTVTPSGLAVDTPSALATVVQLENVPVLTKQLSNSNAELENADKLLAASNGQVTTLNTEVSGLNLQIVDNQKVCTAQIAVVKADAAKSKRRWFLIGVVAGFLGRSALIK
jgi:hypothetical protein